MKRPRFLDSCKQILIENKVAWFDEEQGRYYTWNLAKMELDKYTKYGVHLGTYNTKGQLINYADKGRSLNV